MVASINLVLSFENKIEYMADSNINGNAVEQILYHKCAYGCIVVCFILVSFVVGGFILIIYPYISCLLYLIVALVREK